MATLDLFTVGETVGVVASLNKNFATLLALIQQQGSSGQALGQSTMQAFSRINALGVGSATGTSFVSSGTGFNQQSQGLAVGTSVVQAVSNALAASVGASVGNGVAAALGSSNVSVNVGATGAATGTSTVVAAGQTLNPMVGSSIGLGTAAGIGASQAQSVGAATGSSSTTGLALSQSESAAGTAAAQPTQTIFASQNPGQVPGVNLNAFKLSAQPGQLVVNSVVDSATSRATEIFYTSHTLYYQNLDNVWFQWTAPNTYITVPSPIIAPITESTEGFIVNSQSGIIYASSTPGTAASSTAGVGSGLVAFLLTAAPPGAQISVNTGAGFAVDATTSNVAQLYYHNHSMYQQNSAGNWFRWLSPGVYNNETGSPAPTLQTVNVGIIGNQSTNTTFVVQGTLQGYTTPPTLNYQDDQTGSWLPFPSTTNVTSTSYSFVHPPVSIIDDSFTVGIRDANNIGAATLTNGFWIANPGVATLTRVTLTNASFVAGPSSPAGTVVGSIFVGVAGGTFTGTGQNGGLSVSPSTQFSIQGTNLVTSAVLAAQSYPLTITANQANAQGSPISTSVTVIGNAVVESAEGTAVFATGAGTIFASPVVGTANVLSGPGSGNASDGTLNQFTIVGGVIAKNGSTVGSNSSGVTEIYYHNHTLWQFNGTSWFSMNSDGTTYAGPTGSPLPGGQTITIQVIRNTTINTAFTVQGVLQNYTTAPAIQYMDQNSGQWISTPVGSATTTKFAFTHPGVASPDGAFVVAVRDAATTSVVGTSNNFQVCNTSANNLGTNPAGFVITNISLSNTSPTANAQYSATITAVVSGAPKFTGTYQFTSPGTGPGLNDGLFTITNNAGQVIGAATIQSISTLAANTTPGYAIQITATM